MAYPDIIHETYHISHIAEWFHAFPHVDITFQPVNSTFDPSNSAYLEALGIIIAIPGFWLILTLLAFLIFFLCRCCDSSFKRKRKITPLKWILGLFAILCCGALAVGLYGNETAHHGIVEVEAASRNASGIITSVKYQSTKIERLLADDVTQDLSKLKQMFTTETINQTYLDGLLLALRHMEDNRTVGIDKIQDVNAKLNSFNFDSVSNHIGFVEMIRWPVTIGVLCLLIVLCFTLIWGVIRHSRCLLILFSVFGLLSVVVCWVLVSLYVGICVAGSDFCLEPEPFLYQQTSGLVDSSILTYYIHCDEKIQDPFQHIIAEGTKALKNIEYTTEGISDIIKRISIPDQKQILDLLDHLTEHINQTKKLLESITDTVRCRFINQEYRAALEATCTDTLEGTAFMLVSAVGSGLLFTVLIWVASHTWIHIRKKPSTFERVDEEDPFLPPSSSMPNSRRNRETYGSTGFRPRSSHTPPHTPYFTASVNGQSGSREDHAFLHGRYTPPPAYEQLSGGHFSGHVGSKMHYNNA